MNVLHLRSARKTLVTRYESTLAESSPLADGHGEAHVYANEFQPGGVIGPHEAGFGQFFVFVDGTGWVAGEDGRSVPLAVGEVALIRPARSTARAAITARSRSWSRCASSTPAHEPAHVRAMNAEPT